MTSSISVTAMSNVENINVVDILETGEQTWLRSSLLIHL